MPDVNTTPLPLPEPVPEVKRLLYDEAGRPLRYLRWRERRDRQEAVGAIDRVLTDPDSAVRRRLENKGQLLQQHARMKKVLERQSPPPLAPEVRDKLAKRVKAVEGVLRRVMVPFHEINRKMSELTPGLKDAERRWQQRYKPYINEWKNGQVLLHPESEDHDLANIERLRPSIPRTMTPTTFAPPRGYAPPLSEQGLENYEAIDWSSDRPERQEALAQAGVRVRQAKASETARPAPATTKGVDCRKGCGRPFFGFNRYAARKSHEAGCLGVAP